MEQGGGVNCYSNSSGSGSSDDGSSVLEWLTNVGIPHEASISYANALYEDGFETVTLLAELDDEVWEVIIKRWLLAFGRWCCWCL
jgi:hypothetical protein